MGGGILPVAIYKGKIYFLFSREYINGKPDGGLWSDFGALELDWAATLQRILERDYKRGLPLTCRANPAGLLWAVSR